MNINTQDVITIVIAVVILVIFWRLTGNLDKAIAELGKSKPALDAGERIYQASPEAVQQAFQTLLEFAKTYAKSTETALDDTLVAIGEKISDGKPNETTVSEVQAIKLNPESSNTYFVQVDEAKANADR